MSPHPASGSSPDAAPTPARRLYLVSPAGGPNFGDELLTRAWLDWLAARHPRAEVWLDCIEPGRAAHLFADTHPNLRLTSTLWEIALRSPGEDVAVDEERARRLVSGLGSPQFDLGIEALRAMDSVHLLGGGYLNTLWPRNLAILAAVSELKRRHGVPLYATGQGLMPQSEETTPVVARLLADFDLAESRDREGARALGVREGVDDAFLAFRNDRPVFAAGDSPALMILLQGDFVSSEQESGVRDALRRFLRDHVTDDVGFVEALPPLDARFWDVADVADRPVELYPFRRLWQEGLPARPGQTWLTSRFHFHLLGAAAGARGIAVSLRDGYYDVKHGSLASLGTGWTVETLRRWTAGAASDPGGDDRFAEAVVPELAERKHRLAVSLYG